MKLSGKAADLLGCYMYAAPSRSPRDLHLPLLRLTSNDVLYYWLFISLSLDLPSLIPSDKLPISHTHADSLISQSLNDHIDHF